MIRLKNWLLLMYTFFWFQSISHSDTLYKSKRSNQENESSRKRKEHLKNVFWETDLGLFIGEENRYELSTYSMGFTMKAYCKVYGFPIYTLSMYTGYQHLFDFRNDPSSLRHNIKLGSHFSLFGLETNFFFGNYDQFMWTVLPKIGLDWGHLSFFYGYHIPIINKSEMTWKNFHTVTLSYSVCISEL